MAYKYDSINHAQQDAFDTYLRYKIAGEDLTNDVLKTVPTPLASAAYSGVAFSSFGAATKANVKASPGSLLSVYASNINAAIRYLLLHNKASAPAGADVPLMAFPIPAGSSTAPASIILDGDFWGAAGFYFSTGLGWAISTTGATFTDSATASEHYVNGSFI